MQVLPYGFYCLAHYEMTQEILEHLRNNLNKYYKMPEGFSPYYGILSYGYKYIVVCYEEPITGVPRFYRYFYNPPKCLRRL